MFMLPSQAHNCAFMMLHSWQVYRDCFYAHLESSMNGVDRDEHCPAILMYATSQVCMDVWTHLSFLIDLCIIYYYFSKL